MWSLTLAWGAEIMNFQTKRWHCHPWIHPEESEQQLAMT